MEKYNYKDFVRIKDSKEFRQKINEVDISLLIEEVSTEPKLWADLLIQNKIFPLELYAEFSKKEDRDSLIQSFIIGDFLPDNSFVEELIRDNQDDLLVKLVNKFHSLSFDVKTVMGMINSGMMNTVIQLVKNNESFHKKEMFLLLMNSNLKDLELIKLITKSNDYVDILEQVFDDIETKKEINHLSDEILSLLLVAISSTDKEFLRYNFYKEILNREISYEALHSFVTFDSRNYKTILTPIEYHPKFEAIPIKDFCTKIHNVPENSKLRSKFVMDFPNNKSVSVEELKNVLIESYLSSKTRNHVLIALIRKINPNEMEDFFKNSSFNGFDYIENNFTPSELTDSIFDQEKGIIFHNNLSYKFKKRLETHKLDKENIPKNKNKKSYFDEVIHSIRDKDIESLRDYTNNYGYSLTKFLFDCTQSSKQNKVASVRVQPKLLEKMSKEEILLLIESNFSISYYFKRIEKGEFPFTFKFCSEFANALFDKFNEWEIVYYLDEELQLEFIKSHNLSNYDCTKVLEDAKKGYLSKDIKNAIESKICNELDSIQLDESNLEAVLNNLIKEDILRKVETSYLIVFLDMKKDGEFILDEDDIKKIILELINFNKKLYIERYDFLKSLNKRSPEFCKSWINAYLGGNSHMTKYLGETVNIRRSEKSMYKNFLNQSTIGRDVLIKEILDKGANLEDFKETFEDYEEVIAKEIPEGAVVKIRTMNHTDSFSLIEENPKIKFELNELSFSRTYGHREDYAHPQSNLKINYINLKENSASFMSFMKWYNIQEENVSWNESINLLWEIIDSENKELLNFLMNKKNGGHLVQEYVLSSGELKFDVSRDEVIINNGFILTDEVLHKAVLHAIENHDVPYLRFLEGKVGTLPLIKVSQEWLTTDYSFREERVAELNEFIKERGFSVLSPKDYLIESIKKTLILEGVNFNAVSIEELTLEQKNDLIDFLCEEIDPRFIEIGIKSFNLSKLDVLENYNVMKTMASLNEDDIVSILNIPNNIKNNPKIIKGIVDLMTINSGNFTYKVFLCKQVYERLNSKEPLILGDFIDYSNIKNIEESESFSKIRIESLQALDDKIDEFKNVILKGCNKKQVLRFFRSIENESVLKDTFDMLRQVFKGLEKIEEAFPTLTDEEEINSTKETITEVKQKLNEILTMDDLELLHNRLMPLTSFLKENPNQPIGTLKFKKLHSLDLESELGNNLFFPQNRGDVHYLGSTYGWCVTGACHYTEGVIYKGNVLVGICEKGTPAEKENVIALGHFCNNNGQLRLEQLRWSKLKKNGERNVSAKENFNYRKIMDYIEEFLSKEKVKGK